MSKTSLILACNCLNIIIELDKEVKSMNKEMLNLTEDEKIDPFFRQSGFLKSKLVNVTKVHQGLVSSRKAGQWVVNHCINCDVHTHVFHKEDGASSVLVNPKLLNYEAIKDMRLSDIYSSVFQIVVNPNDVGTFNTPMEACRTKDLDKFIKYVNDVLTNFIRKEELAVEERIKKYTEEQLENLNVFKDRAEKEREALVRVVLDAHSANKNLSLPPDSPKKFFPSNKTSTGNRFFGPGSPAGTPASPKRPKGIDGQAPKSDDLMFQFESDNIVGDGLFRQPKAPNHDMYEDLLFDDIPDQELPVHEEVDEDDEDEEEDEDSGITIGIRSKQSSLTIAKSCPVDIPNFAALSRSKSSGRQPEEFDEYMNIPEQSNREKVDIAASIKALANSVHGDSIFGELPRPRFSTQI